MIYAYEDLSDDQFERLIVILCQKLFGIGLQGFAKGRDGGRDAKFIGRAERYPSKSEPWHGTTIIQAKHVNGPNHSFSEKEIYREGAEDTLLGKELPRIKNLRATKELDHYLLFSNRRLSGDRENELRTVISAKCEIPLGSVGLCGVEQIDLYLRQFPKVAKRADLDPIDSPLLVSSEDLAEIIQALAKQIPHAEHVLDQPPVPRVPYNVKNSLNIMSPDYAKDLRSRYLKDTQQIRTFLAAPGNDVIVRLYESVVEEFQLRIFSKRKDYQTFDEVMEYLVRFLINRDPILRQHGHKRLTRVMLFYMYWNCDIGKGEEDATTN